MKLTTAQRLAQSIHPEVKLFTAGSYRVIEWPASTPGRTNRASGTSWERALNDARLKLSDLAQAHARREPK